MNGVFQTRSFDTAAIPRYMKMIASAADAIIFIAYLIVVWDFSEIFASTYFRIVMPQKVHLTTDINALKRRNITPDYTETFGVHAASKVVGIDVCTLRLIDCLVFSGASAQRGQFVPTAAPRAEDGQREPSLYRNIQRVRDQMLIICVSI